MLTGPWLFYILGDEVPHSLFSPLMFVGLHNQSFDVDIVVKNKLNFKHCEDAFVVRCLTNRFHVAVRLFSNRSQMMSKCGKNKKVAHEAQPSASLMFLPHFDVLCDLLGSFSNDDGDGKENGT